MPENRLHDAAMRAADALLAATDGSTARTMYCDEAEAVTGLFRALGRDQDAQRWLGSHAEGDEPGELHYRGEDGELQ